MAPEAAACLDSPSDADLMRRAARGDVEAFAEIYDRHASLLLALASRMLRSSSEAQDLVHDVLIEAWQAARDYDATQASMRTWLLVRLRSRALDRLGRSARYEAIRVALQPNARSHSQHSAGLSERRIAVREALAELDADVRDALHFTYFEGMTSAEIAERTGVPVGTVKSRLRAACNACNACSMASKEAMKMTDSQHDRRRPGHLGSARHHARPDRAAQTPCAIACSPSCAVRNISRASATRSRAASI